MIAAHAVTNHLGVVLDVVLLTTCAALVALSTRKDS